MRVLLVEEDDGIATAVVTALTDEWYVVTRASDRREGLAVAAGQRYDAVLTDAFGRGPEAPKRAELAALRALAAHAPVVLVTGHGWAKRATPARLGVAAIVPRPLVLDDLVEAVREVAGRARP